MSKFDVLIPAFNAAHFLPGALESVMAQTEQDWHIVVVDDGSTDNTNETVQPYLERLGNRMTYLRQNNSGPSAARNHGIRSSSSPFIAFLDADDQWLPDRLARALPFFQQYTEVGLTYSGISRFREPGKIVDTFLGNTGKAEGYVARQIYTRSMELPCCSVTIRRSVLEAVGMFDETMPPTEDRDLWLRIAQHFRVAFVPYVLALYRLSEISLSSNMPRMLKAQKKFIAKHYGEPGCGWSARRIALARAYKQQAEGYAEREQFSPAIRYALHATVMAPWKFQNLRTAASISMRALTARTA